jgi:hypothetical protein
MCTSHNTIKSHTENKERHVKKGKSLSYAFSLNLIKFENGKRSGPFVELESYQKFSSAVDPAITAFAGGTVHKGSLCNMINGKNKQKMAGVTGREKGVYVQIHPDYVRNQKQERKDFGGKTLDRKFIHDALGSFFSEKKSTHKLLFNTDGEVYNNMGQITRGHIPGEPFGLVRTVNGEYMHTVIFFAHVPNMSLEQKIAMKNNPDLMIAHDESNPATYVMFKCTPDKYRHVDIHAKPMDPPFTYAEFMELTVPEQKSVRVMYSNRAETLRSATQQENREESAKSMAHLENMRDLYRIHCYQRANFQ